MLLKVFALFIFYAAVDSAIQLEAWKHGSSEYKWHDDVGFCKLHYIPLKWTEARLRCQYEGGLMASTLKPSQLTQLMQNRERIFLGIHSMFSKGDYYSLDGTTLDSIAIDWAPNEPDNFEDSESCLALNINGTVADVKCSNVLPYVCCKETVYSHDEDFSCDNETNKCYKFHPTGTTWSRAFMTCSVESSYLAIIKSQHEADYIRELISTTPQGSITGDHKDFAYVGFRSWGERGTWMTIHGQPLEKTGYSLWAPGQPDNSTNVKYGPENCGSFFFKNYNNRIENDKKFNDVSCEKILSFICEKRKLS